MKRWVITLFVLSFLILTLYPVSANSKIFISEVYYDAVVSEEFVEFTVQSAPDVDLTGWYITDFEDNFTLPFVIDVGPYDYIEIRTGTGTDDFDASDGNATIFLGEVSQIWDDTGDEVALYDSGNNLIDFMRYEGGNEGIVMGGWNIADSGPSADISIESVSIQGHDQDDSSNWISSPPSNAAPNIYDFFIDNLDTNVFMHNGLHQNQLSLELDKILGGGVNVTITNGSNVPLSVIQRFEEYINFTLNFYNQSGFNPPKLGNDGNLHVHFKNGSSSSGGTGISSGRITMTVAVDSPNNFTDKWTMEHELVHSSQIQNFTDAGGSYIRLSTPSTLFKDEGMAEYWGARSTMENFGLTFEEVLGLAASGYSGTYDVTGYLDDTDRPLFSNWGAMPNWSGYLGALLFMKCMADSHGEDFLLKIHNAQKNYGRWSTIGANDTVGTAAIEAAATQSGINKSFQDFVTDFNLWLYQNYENNITFNTTEIFNGTSIFKPNSLGPWGTHFERYKINSSSHINLTFTGQTSSNYSVTLVVVKKDGSKEITKNIFVGGDVNTITINNSDDINETILIKTRINGAGKRSYNVTIERGPNKAPNITNSTPEGMNVPVNTSQNKTFKVTAIDPDGDNVTYNWTINGTQVLFSNNTYIFNKNISGIHVLKVKVTDPFGAMDMKNWSVNVTTPMSNLTNMTINVTNKPLIAYWRFENNLQDSSGNNHHLNCLWYCPEEYDEGRNGKDRAIILDYNFLEGIDTFDINDDFTFSLWIDPESTDDGQNFIGKHSSIGKNRLLFGFYKGRYYFNLRGHVLKTGNKQLGWQQIVVTGKKIGASRTEITMYKNGIKMGSGRFGRIAGNLSPGLPWTLGQDWDIGPQPSDFFKGKMDEVRIYGDDLTPQEVLALYQAEQ
jgi:hypothetical protein